MTALYRHFDADGCLLYVGISATPFKRTADHARCADWFSSIARIEIEHHATRADALAAERSAIILECPRHNKMHNAPKVRARGGKGRRPRQPVAPKVRGPLMGAFLKFRVSPEEKAEFMLAAKASGRTLSDMVRDGMVEFMRDAG